MSVIWVNYYHWSSDFIQFIFRGLQRAAVSIYKRMHFSQFSSLILILFISNFSQTIFRSKFLFSRWWSCWTCWAFLAVFSSVTIFVWFFTFACVRRFEAATIITRPAWLTLAYSTITCTMFRSSTQQPFVTCARVIVTLTIFTGNHFFGIDSFGAFTNAFKAYSSTTANN